MVPITAAAAAADNVVAVAYASVTVVRISCYIYCCHYNLAAAAITVYVFCT